MDDSEILQLIQSSEGSGSAPNLFNPKERYLYFPGLVKIEVPCEVWESSPKFDYHCGWALHCSKTGQFFCSRFLHVLLLRLAFSLALIPSMQTSNFPALQRKCKVWKNGICWGDRSGVEALVEVQENKIIIAMFRCIRECEFECAHMQSTVVDKILQTKKTLCPKVTVCEYFLHHSDCKQYPPKPFSELALVTAEEISTGVTEHKPCIVDETGNVKRISDHLGFEPYTDFGISILQALGCQNTTCSKRVAATSELLQFSPTSTPTSTTSYVLGKFTVVCHNSVYASDHQCSYSPLHRRSNPSFCWTSSSLSLFCCH